MATLILICQMRNLSIERIVRIALFVALASVIHYFENLIVIPIPIPGFKLGLANIVGLFVLFYIDWKEYLAVTYFRILLVSLISTGFGTGFLLSFSGSTFAVIISIILYKFLKCSIYSVSVVSALFHATGQVLMYALISMQFYIISYLAILALLSMLAGLLLSIICRMLLVRMPPFKDRARIKRRR